MIFGTDFTFKQKSLSDFNMMLTSFDGGGFDTVNAGMRLELKREKIGLNPIQPLTSVRYDNTLELNMTLVHKDIGRPFSQQEVRTISKWLFGTEYSPLEIRNPKYQSVVFFCIVSDLQYVLHLDKIIGFTVKMTCDAPYGWELFSISHEIANSKSIVFDNTSDDFLWTLKPKLVIANNSVSDFKLRYTSNGLSKEIVIKNIQKAEIVTLDSANLVISSNINNRNFYSNFNREWLELDSGQTTLAIEGSCSLNISGRFPRKVGL